VEETTHRRNRTGWFSLLLKCTKTLTVAFSDYKMGKFPQIDYHMLDSMIVIYIKYRSNVKFVQTVNDAN
jgi:hypothetical protein